ncbi:hypothetical protein T439DRAFT_355610 [Meredithblackwellia eburnea MCA 4105]
MDDFDLLEEASNASKLTPVKLAAPRRRDVLEFHAELCEREAQLDQEGQVRTRRMVLHPRKHYSKKSLEDLNPLDLSGLVSCNQVAWGQVLLCRIVSKPVRMASVQFVVEDPAGKVVPIHVYYVHSRHEQRDLEAMFPVGGFLAIKEPFFRESREHFIIRLDSPLDLVRLSDSSQVVKALSWRSSPSEMVRKQETAEELKESGNRFFRLGRHQLAYDCYTKALDLLAITGPNALTSILLSNRAMCLISLKRPRAALRDCKDGLSSPNLDLAIKRKLLFRQARVHDLLLEFQDGIDQLNVLLELFPEDTAGARLLLGMERRLHESSTGLYDWELLFRSALAQADVDAAPFISSAVTQQYIPGRGRGLVASRSIRRGELLFLAKPLAFGRGDHTRKHHLVGANLHTRTVDPSSIIDLIAGLLERLNDDPDLAPAVFELHAGDGYGPWQPSDGIDVSRLEAITAFNSFHAESLAQKAKSVTRDQDRLDTIHADSALYHFPSFLNHSCIPNVSYSFLDDTIFVRARHDIDSGTELVDSYTDSLASLPERTEVLSKHRFTCYCDLCTFDRKDGAVESSRRAKLSKKLDHMIDSVHGSSRVNSAQNLDSILALVDKLQQTYSTERQPPLRPALYSAWRFLSQTYADKDLGFSTLSVEAEIKALESLGACFRGDQISSFSLREAPLVGDVNAVLSSLFIASQFRLRQGSSGTRRWLEIAREIEEGQGGKEVFFVRYEEWASKNGLDLRKLMRD